MSRYAEVADVRGIAPELGAVGEVDPPVTDAVIEVWLRVAQHWISLSRWGEQATDGHALLAAHLATVSPSGGGPNAPLTGATVGPVSASYGGAPPADELLSTTTHGQAYQALRQLVASTGTGLVSNTLVRLD